MGVFYHNRVILTMLRET